MKLINRVSVIIFFLFALINLGYSQQADSLLQFMAGHKKELSFFATKNDTVIAAFNESRIMPLASTAKIMVAIEFSKQAAFKIFDENSLVPLSTLSKYYIPNTDGNAHPQWISYERQQGHIRNDSVKLIDVARGMILFSSNANTEYLLDLLGEGNVNSNYHLMGVEKYTPLYPWVSSLFLYQNPKNSKEEKVLKQIQDLSQEQYLKASEMIHTQLKYNAGYKDKFRPQDLSVEMQKEWSKRLPSSTTKDYVRVVSILNNRKIFEEKTYRILEKVLESLMENPANRQWLQHAGMKGGSTMFVLTKALYATLKDGTKINLAYFFNNLNPNDNNRIQKWMNDFELQFLSGEAFRKKVAGILK